MTAFTLKLIAAISMLIDHLCKSGVFGQKLLTDVFNMSLSASFQLCGAIERTGRLAFPIFAFFLAEGCRRTRSRKRYVARLLAFGVLSEFFYDMALSPLSAGWRLAVTPLSHMNVLFTLALAALGVALFEALRAKGKNLCLASLPAIACALAAQALSVDYMIFGVLAVYAAYFPATKQGRLGALTAVLAALYLGYASSWFSCFDANIVYDFLAACAAVALLALYNGRRGPGAKWLFYVFYPGHLAVIAALKLFLHLGY